MSFKSPLRMFPGTRMRREAAMAPGGGGVVPRWYNPLDSVAIDARIAAGGLWAWRAQANDNVTWGPGPANYAASLVDEAQGQMLAEIGGGPLNWAAATGWSGFLALNRCLDTGIVPVLDQTWMALVQYSGAGGGNTHLFGLYDDTIDNGAFSLEDRALGTIARVRHGAAAPACDNVQLAVAGNYGFLGTQPYRNGIAEPFAVVAGPGTTDQTIYIGARSRPAISGPFGGQIQAFLLCNDATAFAPADIAAIAALPGGSMHNL